MFKTRLISGIILVILAIFFLYMGGYYLLGCLVFLSGIGIYEYLKVNKLDKTAFYSVAMIYTVLLYYLSIVKLSKSVDLTLLLIIICFMSHMAIYVFAYPKYDISAVARAFFGCIYVPTLLHFILLTRNLNAGKYLVWLIFLSSWGCDTCAYCVGVLFGKHKMSPVLSPKKSIEGAIGGIVGTIILTYVFCRVFKSQMVLSDTNVYIISGLSAIGAFISMVGDLAASAIKRNYDIKDYGKLIPGHGGVLDRFDSVIITAPIIYYLGSFFV